MLNMTGQELRERRDAAGVRQWELAAEMRVASSRVSQIEALALVTPQTVERYIAALGRCLVAKTRPQTSVEVA
jgi:transcriptional regulator with XRE-family HTH domain